MKNKKNLLGRLVSSVPKKIKDTANYFYRKSSFLERFYQPQKTKSQSFLQTDAMRELADIIPAPPDALTLIIPVNQRIKELKALLGYFEKKNLPYEIMLLVSGKGIAELKSFRSLNIRVSEFSERTSLAEKIQAGLKGVASPTVALVADHDICLTEALAKSSGFLLHNKDFSACQGYHGRFDVRKEERILIDIPWYTPSLGEASSLDRLNTLIRRYQPVCWATFQREVMVQVAENIAKTQSLLFIELLWSSTTAILGKVKRLPMIYCLRRHHNIHMMGHPLYAWLESPSSFLADYEQYRGILIGQLKILGIADNHLIRILDLIHGCYFGREVDTGVCNFMTEQVLANPLVSVSDSEIRSKIAPQLQQSKVAKKIVDREGHTYQVLRDFVQPHPTQEIPLEPSFEKKIVGELEKYSLESG